MWLPNLRAERSRSGVLFACSLGSSEWTRWNFLARCGDTVQIVMLFDWRIHVHEAAGIIYGSFLLVSLYSVSQSDTVGITGLFEWSEQQKERVMKYSTNTGNSQRIKPSLKRIRILDPLGQRFCGRLHFQSIFIIGLKLLNFL